MNTVYECYHLTEEIVKALKNTKIEREEKIKIVEELLNKREQVIQLIKSPFTMEEKKIGAKVVQQDKTLQLLLNIEKQEIQKDINGLSKRKSSVNKYRNPYQNMQIDGYFYDKKN
jgi:flagellar protein FliT